MTKHRCIAVFAIVLFVGCELPTTSAPPTQTLPVSQQPVAAQALSDSRDEPLPHNRKTTPKKKQTESEAEKLYEAATGKEVVHRKDGTTYERNQRGSVPSPKTGRSGAHKESAAEREYEKAKGVEVVHRKDGTTYERKARKK